MKGKLNEESQIELWKYFDKKATEIKGAMFTTTTWIIGFAAALLGFLFANLMDFNPEVARISISSLMKLVSFSGFVICMYAFFAINESAKHIRNNWNYADNCKKKIESLAFMKQKNGKNNIFPIWDQLKIIVGIFLLSFVSIFIWSIFMFHC